LFAATAYGRCVFLENVRFFDVTGRCDSLLQRFSKELPGARHNRLG
jgi:hypothetical protein